MRPNVAYRGLGPHAAEPQIDMAGRGGEGQRPAAGARQGRSRRPLGVAWKPAVSRARASGEVSAGMPLARSTVTVPSAPARAACASASAAAWSAAESGSVA
jgi:hypothetical protein